MAIRLTANNTGPLTLIFCFLYSTKVPNFTPEESLDKSFGIVSGWGHPKLRLEAGGKGGNWT